MSLLPPLLPMSQADQIPHRIVVEVISHADVERLERRDEDLRQEIKLLEGKIEGLHRTIYEVMEALGRLRSKRG